MRSRSPLTVLPGNVQIEDEIQTRVDLRQPFAVLYLHLDNLKGVQRPKREAGSSLAVDRRRA
jgi:hypothetical protein